MTEQPNTENIDLQKCKKLDIATQLHIATAAHINSFNFFLESGLENICKHLNPMEIFSDQIKQTVKQAENKLIPFEKMRIWFEDITVGSPTKNLQASRTELKLYPFEARLSGETYEAPLLATIARILNDGTVEKRKIHLGTIPIMVKSSKCNLHGLSPKELVIKNEDCTEIGGYFILNGLDKLLRMLVIPRRNYPFAIQRPTFHSRKKNFTDFAVSMKCVREDLFSQTIYMHYSHDGNIYLNIMIRKVEYLIPAVIVIKALVELSDRQLYNLVVKGFKDNSFISERVEVLISETKKRALFSKKDCLAYLGFLLKNVINVTDPNLSNEEIGEVFLKEHIMVHQEENEAKVSSLILMLQKLYHLVSGKIAPDNLDSMVNHEVLLSGHLYMMFFREKIDELMQGVRSRIIREIVRGNDVIKVRDFDYLIKAIETQTSIGKKMEYLLSTGNLKSQTGLDLMQNSGYSIVAEKLNNMRFFSHMRSLHRGAYFTEMKTTKVRKLLPENWGFLCPVHTPDGGLCGLLNHLSYGCMIQSEMIPKIDKPKFIELCITFGMHSQNSNLQIVLPETFLHVILDGAVIGSVEPEKADEFCKKLREVKVTQSHPDLVHKYFSITNIQPTAYAKNPQFPAVYLYTSLARPLRKVKNLELNKEEIIDPLEQSYMSIACNIEDIRKDTTHQELHPDLILSELATQIPFLEHNQSPRNMYQCQMAKQTMGTPYHNHPFRIDNKIYKINNPQNPIVKCSKFASLGFNEYPSGTNAVIAVISYTGYDIEDAMIINKSSYERGFMHGSVYKVVDHDLNKTIGNSNRRTTNFKLIHTQKDIMESNRVKKPKGLDNDGVAFIGEKMKKGIPEMCYYDTNKNEVKKYYFKDKESAFLEQATLISRDKTQTNVKMRLKYRYKRNPVIGDKFSSRHGQKGVLSVLWPQIDMPFSENGITPDIIINPNAFPSRMTIGMLIESLVGKTGSLDGKIHETRAFESYKDDDAVGYFGNQLKNHGFNYYGNEVLYSGVFGTPLKVDIFIGVVYYQRLRHMVSDKSQARSTGPIDILTRQPVKGRKKGGGIRLGEMERDALIAHGASYCLHERLMLSSDYSEGYVCSNCGSMLSCFGKIKKGNELEGEKLLSQVVKCKSCEGKFGGEKEPKKVAVPYVLRYLANELAAMNIKLTFKLS